MAVAAAAVVLLVLAAARWVERNRGAPEAAVSLAGPAATPRAPQRRQVFVHVAGAVRRPGVYALPRGARGGDAVERAGGPRRGADLTAVNLAAVLEDGQQLVVPVRGAAGAGPVGAGAGPAGGAPAGGAPAGGAAGSPGGGGAGAAAGAGAPGARAKLRLATATQAQLEELDGIGPALAQRILAYREAQGGFRSVDELAEVDGIGEKRLEALRQAVAP